SCASINPLPMSEFVDVFAIGAAGNVLPELLAALEGEENRDAVIERVAAHDGFYVPALHRAEAGDEPPKLNKLELTDAHMNLPGTPLVLFRLGLLDPHSGGDRRGARHPPRLGRPLDHAGPRDRHRRAAGEDGQADPQLLPAGEDPADLPPRLHLAQALLHRRP